MSQTKFWGQQVLFGTKFVKFGPKGSTWQPDSGVQHCELYIGNIVELRCNNSVLRNWTTMNKK